MTTKNHSPKNLALAAAAKEKLGALGLNSLKQGRAKRHDVLWFLDRFGFATEAILTYLASDTTNKLIPSMCKTEKIGKGVSSEYAGTIKYTNCKFILYGEAYTSKIYSLTEFGFDLLHSKIAVAKKEKASYFHKTSRLDLKNLANDLVTTATATLYINEFKEASFRTTFESDTNAKSIKVPDFTYWHTVDGIEHEVHLEIETSPKSGFEFEEFVGRINAHLESKLVMHGQGEKEGDQWLGFPTNKKFSYKIYVFGDAAGARYEAAFKHGTTHRVIERDNNNRRCQGKGSLRISKIIANNVVVITLVDWLDVTKKGFGRPKAPQIN